MNYITRPSPHGFRDFGEPTQIICHAMAEWIVSENGKALHASEFLERMGLSAHALFLPCGQVMLTRREDHGAFHARKGPNRGSLGYEWLVPGQWGYAGFLARIQEEGWCTEASLHAGIRHLAIVLNRHPTIERVVRHSDIDPDKHDPGAGFPWRLLTKRLQLTD